MTTCILPDFYVSSVISLSTITRGRSGEDWVGEEQKVTKVTGVNRVIKVKRADKQNLLYLVTSATLSILVNFIIPVNN